MTSWKLTQNTEGFLDVGLNDSGSFTLVDGAAEVAQDITTSLYFIKNSWFLDLELGVDYYGVVFANGSTRNAVDQEFIDTILNTDGVLSLVDYKSNIESNREFSVVFEAETTEGTTDEILINSGILF